MRPSDWFNMGNEEKRKNQVWLSVFWIEEIGEQWKVEMVTNNTYKGLTK